MKTLAFLAGCRFTFMPQSVAEMKHKIYSAGILLTLSMPVYSSEEAVSKIIKSDPMSGSYLLQLVLGLIVVVLCIIALAWFAKKMNNFQSLTDDSLKIVSAINMGARERIVLLQVGEEQLLVGVSPGRINKLHVLDKPIESTVSNLDGTAGKGFSDKFKKMMADAKSASDKK